MANKSDAVDCIQDLIDVANSHGSACVYQHNGGVDQLENVLECLRGSSQTADQMFRELGYRRKYERTYENKYGVQILVCSRWPGHEEFHKAREEELAFSKEEILACAQLIREKEAEENG